MMDRGEPYMMMHSPAHKDPITSIRTFPSTAKWVTKTATPRNPTSKRATNTAVVNWKDMADDDHDHIVMKTKMMVQMKKKTDPFSWRWCINEKQGDKDDFHYSAHNIYSGDENSSRFCKSIVNPQWSLQQRTYIWKPREFLRGSSLHDSIKRRSIIN